MELSVLIQAELWTQVYKIVQVHVQGRWFMESAITGRRLLILRRVDSFATKTKALAREILPTSYAG